MMGRLKQSVPYWVTLALSGYLFYVAEQIRVPDTGNQLGPDFWPKAALILMMLVCAYEIGRSVLRGPRGADMGFDDLVEGAPAADSRGETQKRYPILLIAGVTLSVLYVALFNTLGFFLDTLLYLTAFILIGRYRRVGVALAVGLAGALIFMFVFMKIVYVSLPIGSPPFSEVSVLLMKLMGIR